MDLTLPDLEQAWDRVRENEGRAGVDGVTVARFGAAAHRNFERLLLALAENRYRPYPLLRILVEKRAGSGKYRRLLVPAVRDRVLQTAIARRLSASFEEEFLDHSYAYRPGRGVDRAIARVCQLRDRGYSWVFDADITSYFDNVDFSLLEDRLIRDSTAPWIVHLVSQWLRTEFWDGQRLHALRKGLPQGSPLSPVLANLFLHDLDVEFAKSDFHMVRYADDFLVLCDSEQGAHRAREQTERWLAANRLELHPEKTAVVQFKQGFTFLGVYLVDENAYTPWKSGGKGFGQTVTVARPMPAKLLIRYDAAPAAERPLARALRGALAESVPTPETVEGRRSVAFLYVTEQGAVLRKSGDRFLVDKDGRVLADLPYHKLESVLVFGNVQLTTQAMGELLEKGIPVSFLTRAGQFRGSLSSPQGKDIPLRMAQFRVVSESTESLPMARETVAAKIENFELVLRRYAGDARPAEAERLEKLRSQALEAERAESLLGLEGTATALYFDALMRGNRSGFAWEGRRRHPAPDPLNAMLSLAYTLLMAEVRSLLESHGLDPYLGFLHQPDCGRASLALDLVEPFRAPVADRFVLTVANRKLFGAADFHAAGQSGGLRLAPESLARYLESWERWMLSAPRKADAGPAPPSLRRELRREVERFVRAVRLGEKWRAFRWDRVETPEEEACDTSSATI